MKKVLIALLALAAVLGMLTTASISSQRNAWKKEAEKHKRALNKLEDEYEKYQKEKEEKITSLEMERDAFSLVNQAYEAENARLQARIDSLNLALEEASRLESQLTQAYAAQEWAEKRVQDALDVLLTPAPSPTPAASPLPEQSPLSLAPFDGALPWMETVRNLKIFSLPDIALTLQQSPAPAVQPSPSPAAAIETEQGN